MTALNWQTTKKISLIRVLLLVLSLLLPCIANSQESSGQLQPSFNEVVKEFLPPPPALRFLTPPKLPPLAPGENLEHVTYRTGVRESLEKILVALGISKSEIQAWLTSVKKYYPAMRLDQDNELHFYFMKTRSSLLGDTRQLKALEIELADDRVLTWERGNKGIAFSKREKAYEVALVTVGGTVETSFVEDGLRAGLNPTLLSQLVDIFSWEVDFENDLQKGDSFKLIYEKRSRTAKNESVSFRILAADIINRDHKYGAIYFEQEKGRGKYYDLDGRSL